MKTSFQTSSLCRATLALFLVILPAVPVESAAPPVRLAVGPFFAPSANSDLRLAASVIPELLAVEMSSHARFQLVEREKIAALWSELNLGAGRLVSRETVTRIGQVLECDWLVSGSLVQAEGRTHVWGKVIDVRDGTVVDLFAEPYKPGVVTNLVGRMATFLDQTGTETRPTGREFVAMGPFVDMSPADGPRREDWSRRLGSQLERHFVDRGYGVTEIAAVGPIFEERRLEKAGLTGNPAGRVKLQTAFWLIDGGCEWIEGPSVQLAVGLRIQRVGGREQMLWMTNAPGRIEADVLAAVTRALADRSVLSAPQPDSEADLLVARGREFAELRSPFRAKPIGQGGGTTWDTYKRLRDQHRRLSENRRALMANYERLHLQNPENTEAKMMLAYCWIGESDPALQERAMQLFREVAANKKEPKWSASAARMLTDEDWVAKMRGKAGLSMARPKDWHSLHMAFEENPNDPEIKCDLGAALMGSPHAHARERGRQLLQDVAAGNEAVQADRARNLLASSKQSAAK